MGIIMYRVNTYTYICVYVRVYRVCIYIYMPGNMRIVPSEWIIDASATFCVYTRHGERRKTKQKKKKKKNAKNKWTRSVWWLQSCIEINRRRFALNDFVLVDSACDVSSFSLFFSFLFFLDFYAQFSSILKKRGGYTDTAMAIAKCTRNIHQTIFRLNCKFLNKHTTSHISSSSSSSKLELAI